MVPNPPAESPGNRWSDLDRPPLNAMSLRRALVRRGAAPAAPAAPAESAATLWTSLEVVQSVGSTNTELVSRARAGDAQPGTVLLAEEQRSGRGRLDRGWSAPARSGIFCSVLLAPAAPVERWGWLPLLAGVAVATALARAAGVDTALKWPNDVLVEIDGEERKIGGILAESVDTERVVLGFGLNVSLRAEELPVDRAGSLALAGARGTDRDPLVRAVLRALADWYARWDHAHGDPAASGMQEAYAAGCATLGRRVRAELPGDESLTGEAVALDGDGRLVLASGDGVQRPIGAGDIVHLRAAD
ncbi:biotin--[acetyl-CoA-carboxylase] ligase [Streptomyces oceani]|uniref:biotin--[biotin carboxyl-carrier protein] ligase n=1 Tax=Streptomyces oceani TaxID=1075402 RepID=A0A1E7KIE6_9ACTN|nr:biotin--[acetyl-CoA-carboxylase] ligase [Streptomyces oceani]OEV03661.1 biotin--acetyl-CoA-carboxylase ligase [Streptomyces oceani]